MPWISRLWPQGAQIDAWIHTSSRYLKSIDMNCSEIDHVFFKPSTICQTFQDISRYFKSKWSLMHFTAFQCALPFPWSPMVRLSAERRGKTWQIKDSSHGKQMETPNSNCCGTMALGTRAELSLCDGGARSPATKNKIHQGRIEDMLGYFMRSKTPFRVSPPWGQKQTFVYCVRTQYVYVQIRLHLQHDFWHKARLQTRS